MGAKMRRGSWAYLAGKFQRLPGFQSEVSMSSNVARIKTTCKPNKNRKPHPKSCHSARNNAMAKDKLSKMKALSFRPEAHGRVMASDVLNWGKGDTT
ncbi:MAG: hypothetical protein RJB14_2360 [Pseudomonadota bacterium]